MPNGKWRRKEISIHSLPKEGDGWVAEKTLRSYVFQSTPSPRRETHAILLATSQNEISIHSLPKEGDDDRFPACHGRCISIHSLPKEGDNALVKR